MSYLVRKIERSRWSGSEEPERPIKADVVANCIRPNGSELSVWFAEDEDGLSRAKLAMLAAMNKLATVDLVVLSVADLSSAGLNVVATSPKVGPSALKPLHRDIKDLNLDSLKVVAEIVRCCINNKAKVERLTLSQCRSILEGAVNSGEIRLDELHEDIRRKLFVAEGGIALFS